MQECTSDDEYPANKFGYDSQAFLNDPKVNRYLYLRVFGNPNDPQDTLISPFSQMNMVMIPYCTGDSHTGQITRLGKIPNDQVAGKSKFYYHGQRNLQESLNFVFSRYQNIKTIWLMGTSAGAGGATVNFGYIRDALLSSRSDGQVHLIEDSDPVVPPPPLLHWKDMVAWQTFLPGAEDCEKAPLVPPLGAESASAMTSRTGTRSKKSTGAARPNAKSAVNSQSTVAPAADELPEAPYPPELDSANYAATALRPKRSMQVSAEPTGNGEINTPKAGTCYYLQATREYNRRLSNSFRYGIISFKWDSSFVWKDPNNNNKPSADTYATFFSDMNAATLAVEAAGLPSKTKHLYINNQGTYAAAGADPAASLVPTPGLCGRHVVTNFGITITSSGDRVDEIQSAHYDFISKMINGSGWATVDSPMTLCPKDVSDVEFTF